MTVDTVTIANNVSVTAATTQNNIQNNTQNNTQNNILHASKENLENKKLFKLSDLTLFLKHRKYRSTGSKKDIINRVLWVCYPQQYPKPNNIELKARGRPCKQTVNDTNTILIHIDMDTIRTHTVPITKTITTPNKNTESKHIIPTPVVDTYTNATCKEDLKRLKSAKLKEIIDSHNLRSVGKLDELVDRVWWILHPNTERPPNIDKKQRGRPSFKKKYIVEFINDSSDSDHSSYDDDDDDYDQSIWTALFIKNNTVNIIGEGKKYFKFKDSNYLFKETINNKFIIHGELDQTQHVTLIEIKHLHTYSDTIQTIIKEVNSSY